MKVLWVIGNGFDLNLRLATGYRSFLERAYSMDEASRQGGTNSKVWLERASATPRATVGRTSRRPWLLPTEGHSPEGEEFDDTLEGI